MAEIKRTYSKDNPEKEELLPRQKKKTVEVGVSDALVGVTRISG